MRQVLLVAAFTIGVAAQSSADDQADFLKSAPPKFVFVSNVNAEKGLFKIILAVEINYTTQVEVDVVEGEKTVKKKVSMQKTKIEHREQEMALDRLRIITAEGNEVPVGDLGGLKGKAVLLATDEAGVSDLFLKLLGKETYVVTIRPVKK